MATIKLIISVEQLDNVLENFDVIKVYRSTTGVAGAYTEITALGTRIPLVSGTTVYYYDDTAGDPSYYYKFSYFHETTTLESSLSEPILGSQESAYVTLDEIRAEGVTVAMASDGTVLALIDVYQQLFERITRQWFTARQMTWEFDGNGTTLAQFPVPIISVTELYANEDFTNPIATDRFFAYTGRGENGPDDRKNPRIRLLTDEEDIFLGTGSVRRHGQVFEIGERNQRVIGSFGYVEPDGSTPAPIVYALKKLVCARAVQGPMATWGPNAGGPVVEEETDRHRREFADPYTGVKMFPVTGTGDPEIDMILSGYKSPIVIKAPRTTFRRYTGRRII